MAGADLWHSVAVPRLGIGALRVTDGPNGARGTAFRGGPTSACFPCGSALGATWNAALRRTRRRRARGGGARERRARAARTDGEHPAHADRRSQLRVLRRGSGALGAAHRRVRAWAPGARRRRLRQALRRQRRRVGAPSRQRRDGRAHAARGVSRAVRGRGARGRRVDGDGRLQPPRRHALHRAPAAAHRHPARRVELRRRGDLGLDRDAVDGAVGDGWHGSRDAGSAAPLRRQDRGRGETRRADRGGRRRLRAPDPRAAREDRRARRRRAASTPPSMRSTAPSTARSRARPPPTRSCCSATKPARCRSTQRSGAWR